MINEQIVVRLIDRAVMARGTNLPVDVFLELCQAALVGLANRQTRDLLGEIARTLGCADGESILDKAKQTEAEATGLFAWKLRMRKALGVESGTDCAKEIQRLKSGRASEASLLSKIRSAADCPFGRDLIDWVRDMRTGIDDTRYVLGISQVPGRSMVSAAQHLVNCLNKSRKTAASATENAGNPPFAVQINSLAEFLMVEFYGECKDGESVVGTAIRVMREGKHLMRGWEFGLVGEVTRILGAKPHYLIDRAEKVMKALKSAEDERDVLNLSLDAYTKNGMEPRGKADALIRGLEAQRDGARKDAELQRRRADDVVGSYESMEANLVETEEALETMRAKFEAEREALREQKSINEIAHMDLRRLDQLIEENNKLRAENQNLHDWKTFRVVGPSATGGNPRVVPVWQKGAP